MVVIFLLQVGWRRLRKNSKISKGMTQKKLSVRQKKIPDGFSIRD